MKDLLSLLPTELEALLLSVGEPKYRALFPKAWKGMNLVGNPSSLAEIMRRFWEKRDNCE